VCADKIKERPGIVAIKKGETTIQKDVVLKAVPGYNGYHDSNEGFNVGFVFVVGGKSSYHGGDTGKVPEMAEMGSFDVALVPIGGTYTMDEIEAAEAVCEMIKPVNVISMHYGYATAGDPIKFAELVGGVSETHILELVLTVKAGEQEVL
jgi:L-ascorbate metabolism protein UlaG (beta-lactamase superfamily)